MKIKQYSFKVVLPTTNQFGIDSCLSEQLDYVKKMLASITYKDSMNIPLTGEESQWLAAQTASCGD